MRTLIALITAAGLMAGPTVGYAQPYDGGWRPNYAYSGYDPCRAARAEAGRNGAVTGGVLGALAGAAVAGHGSRLGGALIGGTVGAVAGNAISRDRVRCVDYPADYHRHHHCRWVMDDRGHQFEVCRRPDGYWRPWGQ